mgnify:CR=1 FL=1
MNYKNRIYDTVTTYMKKLSELDSFEKELAAQERAEIISRVHAAERREEWDSSARTLTKTPSMRSSISAVPIPRLWTSGMSFPAIS